MAYQSIAVSFNLASFEFVSEFVLGQIPIDIAICTNRIANCPGTDPDRMRSLS